MITVLAITILTVLMVYAAYNAGLNKAKVKFADTMIEVLHEAQADIPNHSAEYTKGVIWLSEQMKRGYE